MPSRIDAWPRSDSWSEAGREPRIEDLMADPIVHLVMRRDGLTANQVWHWIFQAQRRLRQPKPADRRLGTAA